MNKLVIIGAGQLGSRHLQALSNLDEETIIYVQDPSKLALINAEKRFKEVFIKSNPIEVQYIENINDIPQSIDLAIISTNSDVRKMMIENLLAQREIKYMIMEKFLFTKIEDFYSINKLLQKKKVKAWVNCPRRMMEFYINLKNNIMNEKILEFNVYGTLWGLATSSIHMIDILSYLTDYKEYKILYERLDSNPIKSKRKGFYELTGNITGTMGNINFNFSSYRSGNVPYTIQIITDCSLYNIRDVEGRYWLSKKENNWNVEEHKFDFIFQSQMTHLAVQQILDNDQSYLTSYDESLKLHLPLFECFNNYFNRNGHDIDFCPIT